MNILAFDTSADYLNIAIETERAFYELNHRVGLKHSEHLLPEIEHLLAQAGISAGELDLIVCSRGPGSFTGLRIGFSTAKGLAEGSSTPLVSVSSLDVYAADVHYPSAIIIPVIDARKRRYYTAAYQDGKKISEELDISSSDLISSFEEGASLIITGPDANKFLQEIGETRRDISLDRGHVRGHGHALIDLGKARFEAHGADSENQGPVYLRKSEAEISRDKGLID